MAWQDFVTPFSKNNRNAVKSVFRGKSEEQKKLPTLNKYQQDVLKQLSKSINFGGSDVQNQGLYQSGNSYLQNLLSNNPEAMKAFEAPYMRQFQEQTIPNLAEQFSGVGGQSSSAFQQALGQAGAGLQENLAALRGGLQNQALPQALNFAQAPEQQNINRANLGLGTQSFQYHIKPGEQSLFRSLAPSLIKSGTQAATTYATGGF